MRLTGILIVGLLCFFSCSAGHFFYYSFADIREYRRSPSHAAAFKVIPNNSLYYECPFPHYDQVCTVPSFSAARSVVSALTGIAIGEGSAKSVSQPATGYLIQPGKDQSGKIATNIRSGRSFSERLPGQHTYAYPESGLITMRQGREKGKHTNREKMFRQIAEAQKI